MFFRKTKIRAKTPKAGKNFINNSILMIIYLSINLIVLSVGKNSKI
jgi:hypothetical protein